MSKVITFSRVFPAYHPRKGCSTFFVEKILNSLHSCNYDIECYPPGIFIDDSIALPKHHTIRSGSRWKVGDKFSPRIWSGKPYQSKQVIIAPDIEIKKLWDFEIKDGRYFIDKNPISYNLLSILSANDGLNTSDFECWFNKPELLGQIICWDESIEY